MLRAVFGVAVISTMVWTAGAAVKKAPEKQKVEKKSEAAPGRNLAREVPPDAKKVGENTWMHTDRDGKTWYYTPHPMGIMKSEKPPEMPPDDPTVVHHPFGTMKRPPAEPEDPNVVKHPFGAVPRTGEDTSDDAYVSVTQQGDTVRFERPLPVGKRVWTRRLSELNEEERRLFDRAKRSPPKAEK